MSWLIFCQKNIELKLAGLGVAKAKREILFIQKWDLDHWCPKSCLRNIWMSSGIVSKLKRWCQIKIVTRKNLPWYVMIHMMISDKGKFPLPNLVVKFQQTFVDNNHQCFAFPAHNLNCHWRWGWWDHIQAIFLKLFYFNM